MPTDEIARRVVSSWEQLGVAGATVLLLTAVAWFLYTRVIGPFQTKSTERATQQAMAEASRAQAAGATAATAATLVQCLEESNAIATRLERMHEQNFKRLESKNA